MQFSSDSPDTNSAARPNADRYIGSPVNPRTFLATDYLNHFNEAIMLLDMVADMPECLDDLRAWSPKTYEQHFHESTFHDRELCIEAYAFVDAQAKKELEDVVSRLNDGIASAILELDGIGANDTGRFCDACQTNSRALWALIDSASGIINGGKDDDDVVELHVEPDHIETTQAAIDALFS